MTEIKNQNYLFKAKDPYSALTHFIGFVCGIIEMPLLLIFSSTINNNQNSLIAFSVFMISIILLYGASTSYHAFNINKKANLLLKKIDHSCIFILIAGSYTPVCLIALKGIIGYKLLTTIWLIAIFGIIFKLFWVTCPKWVSSVIYIGMGWAAISVLPELLHSLPGNGFFWLLTGGIFYTIGGIIYALKLPVIPKSFVNHGFGNHELFHCFVLLGTLCHYIMMISSIAYI